MVGKNSIEIHSLKKKTIFSHIIIENITDADYTHVKRVCKGFEIKNLGEYYQLHVQSDKLLFLYSERFPRVSFLQKMSVLFS